LNSIVLGPIISPRQGTAARVVCFTARPTDVARIARIERIGRDAKGTLRGFQRPRIAAHIREIRDYLAHPEAILPNAIVLAFNRGVEVRNDGSLVVDVSNGPPGWVVDGQQRLSAALDFADSTFELIVSAFICDDMAELNRQFILVNNTRPLAKPLIYELLPGTTGLPHRLSNRTEAAVLTEALNYREDSSLHGLILQQTNPDGIIRDTLLQKLLINSMQHGALRNGRGGDDALFARFDLVSEFFHAVKEVFSAAWESHTPKTSRLLHGVGLVAMGYLMDELHARFRARRRRQFARGLQPLIRRTHWTSGEWRFGDERRAWNALQNTNADYRLLAHHLVRIIRRASTR
jgi:DGQHR domain-containing protein